MTTLERRDYINMIEIKRGGIVHQMMHPFGLSSHYIPKTICEVFWQVTTMMFLLLAVVAIVAVGLGHFLAGLAAMLLVTGTINPPVAIVMCLVGIVISGLIVPAAKYSFKKIGNTEMAKIAKEAYKNHKEKHCTLVQYKD